MFDDDGELFKQPPDRLLRKVGDAIDLSSGTDMPSPKCARILLSLFARAHGGNDYVPMLIVDQLLP